MPCRICGDTDTDLAFEKLLGDAEPGENMLAIARARHPPVTPLHDLYGHWLPDDDDVPRCLNCLDVVPVKQVLPRQFVERTLPGGEVVREHLRGRIAPARIITGYEKMCCGGV